MRRWFGCGFGYPDFFHTTIQIRTPRVNMISGQQRVTLIDYYSLEWSAPRLYSGLFFFRLSNEKIISLVQFFVILFSKKEYNFKNLNKNKQKLK